jgi:hypothetical protein
LYETKDHAVLKVLTISTALQNKPKIGISQPQRKTKKKSRCRWVQKRVYKLFTIMNRSENQETGKGKILYRN